MSSALFGEAGVVEDGAFRTYLVDSSLDPVTASQILRGACLYYSGSLTILPITGTVRGPVAAIASMEWPDPKASRVLSNFAKSTNIGDLAYEKARIRFITGQRRGEVWCLVHIPAGGSNITIAPGDFVVTCSQTGSMGIQPYVRNASFTEPPTKGEMETALDQLEYIVGKAMTNIHTELDSVTGLPSLGLNNADLLSADTPAVFGWVLVDLDARF